MSGRLSESAIIIMLRSKWFLTVIIIVATLFITLSLQGGTSYQFIIKEQRNTVEYTNAKVVPGDKIEVNWIHSVELTPWSELYEVSDQKQLTLIETRFQSFGAGVPYEHQGTVTMEDGYIVIKNLNQSMDHFKWIHSHHVNFEITLNGEKIIDTEDLPHHIPMEFLIR